MLWSPACCGAITRAESSMLWSYNPSSNSIYSNIRPLARTLAPTLARTRFPARSADGRKFYPPRYSAARRSPPHAPRIIENNPSQSIRELLYYYITISLYYYITILLNYYITILLYYYITRYYITRLLDY